MNAIYYRLLTLALALALATAAPIAGAQSTPAGLRAKYDALGEQLRRNDFGRPLALFSSEAQGALQGEVYALFDHPFEHVKAALDTPQEWCDVLLLPINSKFCRVSSAGSSAALSLGIGKGTDAPEDAHVIDFRLQPLASSADHFAMRLLAGSGPLGTSDYRILVEAIPVDGKRTFLHFTYAYRYGMGARLAMQAYLGTVGRDKVGFTVLGRAPNGGPQYVDGMRGVVERNAMRYYLAIEAALQAFGAPPRERLEQRVHHWFSATESYPLQLREISRAEYVALKMADRGREQVGRESARRS